MGTKDIKRATISSLFWKLFEQGGSSAITLLVQVVMARLLAPDEFGMLAIMLVFVNIGNVVVQSGLNTAIIQVPDASERDYSTVFWMSLAISAVLYAASFALAPAVAAFYESPAIVAPLRVLVLILVVNAYGSVQVAIVSREMEFRKTARATVVAGLTSGALGIAVALLGGGIWALVIQQLLFQVMKCVVLSLELAWRPRLVFDAPRAALLFRFGWKLLVSGILDQGYQSLADLIIGKQFNKTDLGYVSQGKKYPNALGLLLDGAIQPVMLSAASRVQDDISMVKRLARRGLKTSTFLIFPAMTLFALTAHPILLMLLGEKWLPSVWILQIYCFIYALLPIHTTNLQVLNGMGRSDLFLKLEIAKSVVGLVVLCVAAFAFDSIQAILVGYVLSAVLSSVINAFPNKREIGYGYLEQIRDICPAFALSLAAAAVAWPVSLLALPGIVTVLLQAVVLGVAYLLLARLFRIEELSYILKTLRELRTGGGTQ